MFSETVAQKPTVALRAGTRNLRKSAKFEKRDGAESIGPNPPAERYAQPSNSKPTASRTGALIPCRKRMYSMPLRITARLISQNAKKQMAVRCSICAQPGKRIPSRLLTASPPTQV